MTMLTLISSNLKFKKYLKNKDRSQANCWPSSKYIQSLEQVRSTSQLKMHSRHLINLEVFLELKVWLQIETQTFDRAPSTKDFGKE